MNKEHILKQNEKFISIGSQVGKWTKVVNCHLLDKSIEERRKEVDEIARLYPRNPPKKRKKKVKRMMKAWKK